MDDCSSGHCPLGDAIEGADDQGWSSSRPAALGQSPKQDKMMKPQYQEIPSIKIPEATDPNNPGVHVRVIAGSALGKESSHRYSNADHVSTLQSQTGLV